MDARVVRGRCLPYGEGITYWPVVEVVKQLDALPPIRRQPPRSGRCSASPMQATSAEEIAWAFRKLLEEHAPLVVAASTTFSGARRRSWICSSRWLCSLPDRRSCSSAWPVRSCSSGVPAWPVTLRLEPLAGRGCRRADRRRGRRTSCGSGSRRAAGGNPLFVDRDACDDGTQSGGASRCRRPCRRCSRPASTSSIPPSGAVLERGAVEGEVFHRGAVQALAPEETQVTPRLAALVRKRADPPRAGAASPARTASAFATC